MIKNFQDKVAVVTGGAGGIGMAIAQACLNKGMKVAIADVSQDALDEAVITLDAGDRVIAVRCDVSSMADNQNLADEVEKAFGGANLLCLNAGIGRPIPLPQTSEDQWRLQVGVNLDGPFFGTQAFLSLLEKEDEAHIVVTGSVMSLFSGPIMGAYYATKAGVLSFSEALYLDLQMAESKIGVSCLMPGDTKTNVVKNNTTEDMDPEMVAALEEELKNATPPEVVADGVLNAVETGEFYVLPNPGSYWDVIDARFDRIRTGKNPQADYDTV